MSWLSSRPGRRAPSPSPADLEDVRCPGDLRQDLRTFVSNSKCSRVLHETLHYWRMCAEDLIVISSSSRVLVVRSRLF